jgi:hypothetical protein
MADKAFNITKGQGFQLVLPNGLTLSTQFGYAHYHDGRDLDKSIGGLEELFRLSQVNTKSDTCEVAILDAAGDFVTNEVLGDDTDDVRGWVTMEEWLEIFEKAKAYSADEVRT